MGFICNIYLSRIICDIGISLVVLLCDFEVCSSQNLWFDSHRWQFRWASLVFLLMDNRNDINELLLYSKPNKQIT